MTGALTEATGKDGRCRICGAKLGLLQRVSKQEFCSPAHRNQFLRVQEQLALACLQESQTADEQSKKPLEDFADPSDGLLEAVFADPADSETGPVAAPAENAILPSPHRDGDPDPGEAGFVDFECRLIPAVAALVDQEAEFPSTILQVFPQTAASKTRDGFLPAGGYVWNLVPLRSSQPERLLETCCPSAAALPRLACAPAEFEFAREDANEAAQGQRESAQEPDNAGPGSQQSAQLSGSSLFPLAAPHARVVPPSIYRAAEVSPESLPVAPAIGSLVERTHPPSLCGPPAPRKGMRATLGIRDPGAEALLDPLPCPFGGEEQAWQPEL